MRATNQSVKDRRERSPYISPLRSPLPLGVARFPIQDEQLVARDRALARFVNELSPAAGPEFFQLLVDYVADCLGFETVVVAELPAGGDGQLLPLATHPANLAAADPVRVIIETHCERLVDDGLALLGTAPSGAAFDLPVTGADGRPVGVICGFGDRAV